MKKHNENLLCCTHPLPPILLIPKISTYSIYFCYHRILLNPYCISKSFASSENIVNLIIFTVLMSYWFQFAKYGTYLIVFTAIDIMLKIRR
jgi:hypothetical protein